MVAVRGHCRVARIRLDGEQNKGGHNRTSLTRKVALGAGTVGSLIEWECLGSDFRNWETLRQIGRSEMKDYAALIERTPTGWSAYVPDLPGLGVAAKTLPRTKQLLRQAIEMHIAGMREDGLRIPKPQTQVMRLAIPA